MQSTEVYYLLSRRILFRVVFCKILSIGSIVVWVSLIVINVNFNGSPCYGWAILAFLVGGVFHVFGVFALERARVAWRLAEEPRLVYWAHPTDPGGRMRYDGSRLTESCSHLVLHLRDGSEFSATLPPRLMRLFISWLIEKNPSVRLGAYDGPGDKPDKPESH